MKYRLSAFVLLGLFSAFGCSKESDRPALEPASGRGTLRGVNQAPGAAKSARESLAEARCAREQRCDNVGDNKKYSSGQDCLSRIRADWKDDLNDRECPNGVNQKQLDECLDAVRG